MGRPPIGDRAMTSSERQRRFLDRLRGNAGASPAPPASKPVSKPAMRRAGLPAVGDGTILDRLRKLADGAQVGAAVKKLSKAELAQLEEECDEREGQMIGELKSSLAALRDHSSGRQVCDAAFVRARGMKIEEELTRWYGRQWADTEPAQGDEDEPDVSEAIVAWWKDADGNEREWLLNEIGIDGHEGIISALFNTDTLTDWLYERLDDHMAENAEERGYFKLPDGVLAAEFDNWLASLGFVTNDNGEYVREAKTKPHK
jgi:hypothetical protein